MSFIDINCRFFSDKELSDVQEVLEKVHTETLRHFPLNPLQKSTRIPFEMFNAPLKIREDLEFKQQTHKTHVKKEYKEVADSSDLFEMGGRPAETIYMLGEAGRGKTGQCYQLVQHWVEARKALRETKKLSEWQKGLLAFDFLFFVSLRHVDKRIHSVIEMICSSAMKKYPQYHDTVRQILTGKLRTSKCLIVLDGLDERKHEMDINVAISSCTVLMTSRHWKFHDLAPYINERDRVVEVLGLDDNGIQQVIKKVLVNYFEINNRSTELETKVSEIFKNIKDGKYKSIMDIPLLLTASVHLWQSNILHQGSMTSFYASLLNILIKIAYEKSRVKGKQQSLGQTRSIFNMPALIKKQTKLKDHFETLVALGRVAYDDLVLGKQSVENELQDDKQEQKPEISQLVFEKEELIKKVGEDVLQFSLDVGLLNQASAPGSFDEENVSINFFHKTIEEFLAALNIVCNDEVSFESFLNSCSCLKSIMELSNVLIFLEGLQPSLGNAISKHIARIANSDADIIRYRQGFDDKKEMVKLLFNLLCDCAQDMEYSRIQSEMTVKSQPFLVSDVYVDPTSDKWTVEFSTKLLEQGNDDIVSLNLDYKFCDRCIPFTVVEFFLDRSSSLQALYIEGDYKVEHTLRKISPIFSTLTSVSLEIISLTSNAAHMLMEAIQLNTKLQTFKLLVVHIKQNTSDCRDIQSKTHSWVSRSTVFDDTGMGLNLKKNEQLRTLDITFSDYLIGDITHCKLLVNLCLDNVRVQSADVLQMALTSFTQLQNLKLEEISFPNDKTEKLCLDLSACTNLKALNVTIIHVDSIEVNPLNLESFKLNHVSGALRGLLSVLPECQHLTDLSIGEQDFEMLKDVLPRMTQIRDLAYEGENEFYKFDRERRRSGLSDAGNEKAVSSHTLFVQTATKMTWLNSLRLKRLDMGAWGLTLTPLMTNIKRVELWDVKMTARSWGVFIASLLTIQHGFDILLLSTNIDDESVSIVRSSPHLKVLNDKKTWKEPHSLLYFSKLPL